MLKAMGHSHQQMKPIVLTILLVGSIALIAWISVGTFWSIQHVQDDMTATIALEEDVSQLRAQYVAANPDSLDTDLKQADQLLIQNYTHLAQWAQELQQQGKQWDLGMQYRIVKTRQSPAPVDGVSVVPMELHVVPYDTHNAYRAYLQFLRAVEHSGPRVDIQEVTVIGDGKNATHLTVGLSIWMKNRDSVEL
jgi:hypothetical protein